jgi:hypothetical protein
MFQQQLQQPMQQEGVLFISAMALVSFPKLLHEFSEKNENNEKNQENEKTRK